MRLDGGFRPPINWTISILDFREETVAATRNCFYKSRAVGGVAKGFTDFIDGFVKPMVEIHKGICGPELLLQVLTTYYLSSVLDKHSQELKWLLLDSDLDAVLSEFVGCRLREGGSHVVRTATSF
jgi:hypothetical protein